MKIKTLNPNHVVVFTEHEITLYSYDTEIATLFADGKLLGLTDAWNYSNVTTKYLYQFLREYCMEYIQVGKMPDIDHKRMWAIDDNKVIKKFILKYIEEYGTKKVLGK